MNPLSDQRELHGFVDGELDLRRELEIESLAQRDPQLHEDIASLQALRAAVRRDATYHAAPADLRASIAASLAAQVDGAAAPALAAPRRRAWPSWPSFAAGLAAGVLALAIAPWSWRGDGQRRIEDDVLASHARAVVSQRLVDVASSDHHTVKPWLSQRLDFSPPVDPPPGTELLGARVDYVGGRPVAALVMRHGRHLVDAFVWPAAGAATGVAVDERRGFEIARWRADGLQHWVVSDLNRREFDELVSALRAEH